MIRINLAQKKQASYVGGSKTGSFSTLGKSSGGGAGSSAMSSLREMMGSGSMASAAPLLLKILIPVILSIGAYYGVEFYTQQKVSEMAQETETISKEKTRIEAELRKIKGFETVKVELERNELIIRTKIQTIERLIRGRDFTVKSLVVLSQALPKELWLTDMIATENSYSLRGSTVDIGLVSDLMSKLGQTIYFKDVTLKSTSTDAVKRQAIFELSARRE